MEIVESRKHAAELRSADGSKIRPYTSLLRGEGFTAHSCVDGVEDFQAVDACHPANGDGIAEIYNLAIFVCERWPRGEARGVGIA
jgi:hypothetical protein